MNLFILLISFFSSSNALIEYKLDTNPRIMGGENAKIEEFPSLIAIIHLQYEMQWCAGTIISENWVLTAAHCYLPIDQFILEYATTELRLLNENAKTVHPDRFIQHELYSEDDLTYDIGLIQTKEAIQTGIYDQFVKLAVTGDCHLSGTSGIVVGWGIWSVLNFTRPPLQKTELKILNYKSCQLKFDQNPFGVIIHSHQICAGLLDNSRAACSGDSGGPIFLDGVQVGIVSWSIKPCTEAGVYTDVSFFIPWITEKTEIEFQLKSFLKRKSDFSSI